MIPAAALEAAYRWACETELLAFKPGNVSVHSEGHGMTVAQFRKSAEASAPELCRAELGGGERIYRAVEATWHAVGCNTNLGIVLLSAPLIAAAQSRRPDETLRDSLRRTLYASTVEDAEWAYRAICLAQPGGLGTAAEHDVRSPPCITLRDAMREAADRDRIAYQYTCDYTDVFDFMIPRYHTALSRWDNEGWAAVAAFSGMLARIPDSHIERKFGPRYSPWVSEKMVLIEKTLSYTARPESVLGLLRDVDADFKTRGINPGTTADLTVAGLLAVRLETIIARAYRG
ncbi:triphosphoribosyl-dephospho-CoA synthase [Methylococcus geothermalis]|uniref:Triphosphoribosyl-dephospho-CoA synthase n=1 Tax=Methylococcus geothermalis TaxID=2681310 RepID=A0A858Q5M3_9GAMM|nr:triphosphoribosyl-dephospho-CoA synthase [Methylococcus geothermalis]QJD29127.1 triphosphoribosyl-dephospho-CoA synthase [Methylococcus geothermalis]